MTENINILLSESTTEEEKINAANNIITKYNLHLTTEEFLKVFAQARFEINNYSHQYTRCEFLFEYLLNQNIDMFIAIAKCCSCKEKPYWILSWCFIPGGSLHAGSNQLYSGDIMIKMYKNLLDYNNFDIDGLVMTKENREKIQEYRNEKYGGRLTKVAKK